jgi:hypothetical protein
MANIRAGPDILNHAHDSAMAQIAAMKRALSEAVHA